MPRRIQKISYDDDEVPYEVEMSDDGSPSIVTDMEDAVLIYTFDQTSPTYFSAHFIETLALALAIRICIKLSGKMSLKTALEKRFKENLFAAPAVDATGNTVPREERMAVWHRARS